MKRFAILLLTGALLFSCAQQNPNTLTVKTQTNQFDLLYQGKTRLAGGAPFFENSDATFNMVQKKRNALIFKTDAGQVELQCKMNESGNIAAFFVSPNQLQSQQGTDFLGLFFENLPEYKQGVAMWRYKPWNSWTKPVHVSAPAELESWDVQFYYWQYADGLYGAALPMGGQGYRSTLGQNDGQFGAKAVSYVDGLDRQDVPLLAVGFSDDPYQLFADLFTQSMTWLGKEENLRVKKTLPTPFKYLGWCTWNASDNGQNLDEAHIMDGLRPFLEEGFPLGWVLVDDGWFNQQDRQLTSLQPNADKFPHDFAPVIDHIKKNYRIPYVGVWHTINGYWNGIAPTSPLGQKYADELFSWQQPLRADMPDDGAETCYFIKPDSDSLAAFYQSWHKSLKAQGFDFVKVDNQLVVERMANGNYPIFDLADSLHTALNKSVMENFDGGIINCMDMTADAWTNFGQTAVARSVEDYFEYSPDENYDLQKGNAAAHVLQAVYNAIYFGQMVYPDFDMFQTHNPNAEFHAIARAANCGPIYVTDRPGQSDFNILNKLVLATGQTLRADTPLLPTRDCLFQLQDRKAFKAFSLVGETGLLAVWNCADADQVSGLIGPSDIEGLQGNVFVIYDYFAEKAYLLQKDEKLHIKLGRMEPKLYYIINADKGVAPLGLIDKYNAPQTIGKVQQHNNVVIVDLKQGGKFACVAVNSPEQVFINNSQTGYIYKDGIIYINVPMTARSPQVRMVF